MQVAAEIQRSMLPRGAPQVSGYELVGSNAPCHTVGGDYYDFALENGRLLLALGDVSGKGTGAALLMAVLRAAVRANWGREAVADAVGHINQTACQNVPEGKFITFFLAQLEPDDGRALLRQRRPQPPRSGAQVRERREPRGRGTGPGSLRVDRVREGQDDDRTWRRARRSSRTGSRRPGTRRTRSSERPDCARWSCRAGVERPGDPQAVLDAAERFGEGTKATDDRTMIVLKRWPPPLVGLVAGAPANDP